MWPCLLTLVALGSQAFSLIGPAFVVCRDRHGRVTLELVGRPCTHCHGAPTPAAGGGCCHHRDTPADPPATVRSCDCEHVPVADGVSRPCVVPDRVAAEPPALAAPYWVTAGVRPVAVLTGTVGNHDPPGSGRTAHLALLAGVLLRC